MGLGGHLQAVMYTVHEMHGEKQLGNAACYNSSFSVFRSFRKEKKTLSLNV